MSQAGRFFANGGGGVGSVFSLTGDNGLAVFPDGVGNINVLGTLGEITVTGNPGTNTLTLSLDGSVALQFDGDTGSAAPVLGVINIVTRNTIQQCGSSVLFNAVGDEVRLEVTDGGDNTLIGRLAGNAALTGIENVSIGGGSLEALGNGSNNFAGGFNALGLLVDGDDCIAIGHSAGINYTSNESDNIVIGNSGVLGESNTIRIGNIAQTQTFITGIESVDLNTAEVVTIVTDQLGSATLTAGAGITITPGAGIITIAATGADLLAYTAVNTTPYLVLTTDEFLGVDCSGGAITIQLPNAPSTGRVFYIKDSTGNANTFNISVTTVGGVVTIDGVTTYTMNTQFSAISVIFNGASYEIW